MLKTLVNTLFSGNNANTSALTSPKQAKQPITFHGIPVTLEPKATADSVLFSGGSGGSGLDQGGTGRQDKVR